MLCYRDMTFCIHGNGCTCHPNRRLTDEVRNQARDWWGGDDAPIAMSDLCEGKPRETAKDGARC